ncbi:hypothetical protein JNM87_05680 [Candidatus Saccharibacteria bacterium]|nr:hypothetical protein [Candidatus Saccharibacteria bacterium]
MAKKNKSTNAGSSQTDGGFILKVTLYVILGSLWLKVTKSGSNLQLPLPLGMALGILFTTHEHFKIDRKIEYAVLVVAALFGFVAPYGLFINL